MPYFSTWHGMSGDEWSLIIYGHDIYNYFFNGSDVALDYDKQNWAQVAGLALLWWPCMTFTCHLFAQNTCLPHADELTFRHIVQLLNWRSTIYLYRLIS